MKLTSVQRRIISEASNSDCKMCKGKGYLSLRDAKRYNVQSDWPMGGFVSCPCTKSKLNEEKEEKEGEEQPGNEETRIIRLPRCSKCGLILNLETNKCDNCAKWDKGDTSKTQRAVRPN